MTLPIVAKMAERFEMEPAEFERTVRATVCPSNITNEQFVAFMMVAKEYNLNPITKQIYAFPSKGGIVPIVSIDGWLRIINENPQFDGMEFADNIDGGKLASITCRMFRKDRSKPTEVTEYMSECAQGTDPWKKYPARMLRHKSTIQAARYAFGLAGIYDEDEAGRIAGQTIDMGAAEVVTERKPVELPPYPKADFAKNLPAWRDAIAAGKAQAEQIIARSSTKYTLSAEQKDAISQPIKPANVDDDGVIDAEFVTAMEGAPF
jgi:phage recombination protein Bet